MANRSPTQLELEKLTVDQTVLRQRPAVGRGCHRLFEPLKTQNPPPFPKGGSRWRGVLETARTFCLAPDGEVKAQMSQYKLVIPEARNAPA